ncbi:hypothetical protein CXG81DRAFT_12982 [Caulochytrium protostelioides]|uniref:serine C-palmitoyltransferase n=1 Tax=Caulochytrium protostelioides TaxID=1555241 RepID=A0A4P9X1L8_9FUNG|nr:PLP-dependent transferase [Caulochytrium protostelioides]RKP00634.1 hypothetical protein CXG81DRAFT_12982 [Caulochytrium protostelioides]|eukprot:RKP00634.1 hypothetical protein CXG81DRAFT_12982 [Caulochytrium protostelioides]
MGVAKAAERKNSVANSVLTQPPVLHNPAKNPAPVLEEEESAEDAILKSIPSWVVITTYLSYIVLIVVGHVRDFFGFYFRRSKYSRLFVQNGYAPISSGFDTFYHRHMYMRLRDVFNRPITGVAGRTVHLLDRVTYNNNETFELTGKVREVLNLSSYNYLGFAQCEGPCAEAVEDSIRRLGIASTSPRTEIGSSELHYRLEETVAEFVGQEAALVVNMGFATNSTTIPALVGKGCLIISDELNHASLVSGSRLSGANIRVFKHNNARDLEQVVRDAIAQGQDRTHRPWKKILVVIEGLYSMEGNICCLPEIVALRRKYGFYLYLDEAHSIGAMGPNGRGICDYFGVNPKEVDILMGTFTKSFGAAGGYISGSKDLINSLRLTCHSSVYAESMPYPVLTQVYSSLRIIMGREGGDDGRRRIATLARNQRWLSQALRREGFVVLGHDSPVIPVLLMHPAKICLFSRLCLERGLAIVVVGYPATPIIASRVRICVSAAHSMEDLRYAMKVISEVGDILCLKFGSKTLAPPAITVN